MIKVTSITDALDSTGLATEVVVVTFQKFEGYLSFNVSVPIRVEDLPEGKSFEQLTRLEIVAAARARASALILSDVNTELPEPEVVVPDPEPDPEPEVIPEETEPDPIPEVVGSDGIPID